MRSQIDRIFRVNIRRWRVAREITPAAAALLRKRFRYAADPLNAQMRHGLSQLSQNFNGANSVRRAHSFFGSWVPLQGGA